MMKHKNATFILGLLVALLESAQAQEINRTSLDLPFIKYQNTCSPSNPFDKNADGKYFFYDGAFSCLVNDRKDLNSFHNQSKAYVVFELERMDLVQDGVIIKNFEVTNDSIVSNKNKQFVLLSNEENIYYFTNGDEIISTTSYEVTVQGKPFGGLSSIVWEDYESCKSYAQKYSQETGKILLVSQILFVFDRH